MRISKLIALAVFLQSFMPVSVRSQGTIWHFGNGAGLDFNSGTPVAIGGGASFSLDNSTTATDLDGNLLFYSNGFDVWNANHQVMPNGDGLLGSNNSGQCALAVHRPGSNQFYLFTVDQWSGSDGLRYSIVDMDLEGGLGDVTIKNQLLHTPNTERLEAVRNPVNGSWWLISHDWGNNSFRAYNIDENGLNTTPVISMVGSVHSGDNYNAAGQLTASPDGTMLCCGIYVQDLFQVFDFDATTGVVTNPRDLPGYTNAWGCAFSPSNELLYLTKWYDDEVWQVDLSAGTWVQVQNSAVLVGTTSANVSGWQAGYLQLGPDDLVYMAIFGENSIARISSPDALGTSCVFEDAAVSLGSGECNAGLCRTATGDVCALSIALPAPSGCAWTPLEIVAQVAGFPASWSWDLGDGSISTAASPLTHTYFTQGTYVITVSIADANGNCVDSAQASVLIGAPETAGADTSIVLCDTDPPVNLFGLLSTYADGNGTWLDAWGIPIITMFDPATQSSADLYYAINGVHCGPDTSTISIEVLTCTAILEQGSASDVRLFPNPANDRLSVQHSPPSWRASITVRDSEGRIVLAIPAQQRSTFDIDLSRISPGTYQFWMSEHKGETIMRPFVKLP